MTTNGAFVSAGLNPIADCDVTFAGKLQLTGLSAQLTAAGLEVKYRWRCLKPVDLEYWCFTHFLDARGNLAGYLGSPDPEWRSAHDDLEGRRRRHRASGVPNPGGSSIRIPESGFRFPAAGSRSRTDRRLHRGVRSVTAGEIRATVLLA